MADRPADSAADSNSTLRWTDWISVGGLLSGLLTLTRLFIMSVLPYAFLLVYLAPAGLILGSISYRRHRSQYQLLLVHVSLIACLCLPTITQGFLPLLR